MRKIFSIFSGTLGFFSGLAMLVLFIGLVFTAVGFSRYAKQVSEYQNSQIPDDVDGIVILTGGKNRVQPGLDLLKSGAAGKLLISGINQQVSEETLADEYSLDDALKTCCVTFDYSAQNTVGNADQTKIWAEKNNIKRLIVVTNDYHLPRSLTEIRQVLPKVDVQPFSVPHPLLEEKAWYTNPRTIRLLATEYSKFIASSLMQDYKKASDKVLAFMQRSFASQETG